MVQIDIIFSFFCFSIFWEKRKNRKMSQESEIISFFSFSNNSKKIKNSKISLLAVYSIFCIFEADFKIRKMKKPSFFLTIFLFSIFVRTLKYVNMIRISNISFFRFCWKNEKLDWPKCARTQPPPGQRKYLHFSVIFKTLSIGPAAGIEPATSRSAVKRSTD